MPVEESHARLAVRGGLTVILPFPSGPPIEPERGAGDEVAAVVMIPDRRDKREAELPAMKPNVLVVGRWVEINVVPGVTGGTANRPIERSEGCPQSENAPPGKGSVTAEKGSGGVRPASGAASTECGDAPDLTISSSLSNIAAPEDGRTPIT